MGIGRESQAGLALVYWSVLPGTEDEKAEAREFEEDQVAGRLKEDVVRVEAQWWEEGWAGLARGPHPVLSLQLEQRGRLQKSVAKEVSGRGTWV